MSRPGFYDDAELSKKVFDEVGDLKGKLTRFEKAAEDIEARQQQADETEEILGDLYMYGI